MTVNFHTTTVVNEDFFPVSYTVIVDGVPMNLSTSINGYHQ